MKTTIQFISACILLHALTLSNLAAQVNGNWMHKCLTLNDQQLHNLGMNYSKHCLSFSSKLPNGETLDFKADKKGIYTSLRLDRTKNRMITVGKSQNYSSACPVIICDASGKKYFTTSLCEANCRYLPVKVELSQLPDTYNDAVIFVLIYNRDLKENLKCITNKEEYLIDGNDLY
jgi:hypothetical protein